MHNTDPLRRTCFASRTAILAAFACASSLGLYAQGGVQHADLSPTSETSVLISSAIPAPNLASIAGVTYSSSAAPMVDPIEAERVSLGPLTTSEVQPPPRRRYGRPRYRDNTHNADGSNKYAFIAGAGLTLPTGNTYHYLNTSYGFQVGGGRNFNKNFSLIAQFDYDRFGFNGGVLTRQQNFYNTGIAPGDQNYITALDGSSHVWSLSLNPVYNIYSSEGLGAYIVAGVGFYHKTANFTVPTTGYYYDQYYGTYIPYQANQTIDKYTSNAPGYSGGFGLTYKPSRFAGERLYAEARYVFVSNSQRTYAQPGNFYPANSNRTTYIPIKAGIRF